jgi:hypothetical protein
MPSFEFSGKELLNHNVQSIKQIRVLLNVLCFLSLTSSNAIEHTLTASMRSSRIWSIWLVFIIYIPCLRNFNSVTKFPTPFPAGDLIKKHSVRQRFSNLDLIIMESSTAYMRNWGFHKRYCWRFECSVMWCRVLWWVFPVVSKYHSVRVKRSGLLDPEDEGIAILRIVGNHPLKDIMSPPRRLESSTLSRHSCFHR